jgi:sugar phosphate isomerase/epimerase
MSDTPRFSICPLTLPDNTFEEDLGLIAASGATGISVSEEKIREGEDEELLRAFQASSLSASVCIPTNIGPMPPQPPLIYDGPQDPDTRVELMCQSVRRLAPFEPDSIVVITGSAEGRSLADATKIAVEGIREVAIVAKEEGTRLALEPCRYVGFDGSFVRSLAGALELIDEIGQDNVGVCFDVYHLWDEEDGLERAEANAQRVFGVQVNDWREPPRGFADRLIPGDGTIDLPGIFGALVRGGYTGWFDFELFSDDGRWGTDLPDSLWKLPPEELVERGLAGMEAAWQAAPKS